MDVTGQVAEENYNKFCHFLREAARFTMEAMQYMKENLRERAADLAESIYNSHEPSQKLQQMMYEARLEANKNLACLKEKGYLSPNEAQQVSYAINDLTKYENLEDGISNLAGLNYLSEEMGAHMRGEVCKETFMKEVDIMPQMTDALGDVTKINQLGKNPSFENDIERAKRIVELQNKALALDVSKSERVANLAKDAMERLR